MEKDLNILPKKYLVGRESLEGKIVLSYYKKPELLDDYPLKPKEDLLLEESRSLYKLVNDMYNSGIVEMDIISV